MTDDERLAALFRAAASDTAAPPPGFGYGDVVAASRRITVRRRSSAVAAAVAIGLVGLGAVVVLPGSGPDSPTSAAAPLAVPEVADERQARASAGAAEADAAGTAGEGSPLAAAPGPAPLGPGSSECADRQDPALRALVEQVLPEVTGARAAATTDDCLPGTDRYLALEVTDGGVAGVLSVGYVTGAVQLAPGALSAPTASGAMVVVASIARDPGAPPPFTDRLPALLELLAPRL